MHARGNRAGVKVTTRENRMELTAHSVKAAQWLKLKRSFLTRDYIEVTACAKYKYLSRKIVLGTHSICWPVLELKTGRRTKGGAAGTRRVQVAPSSTACCPTSYIEKRRRWHSNLIVVSASEEGAAAAHAHTICLSLSLSGLSVAGRKQLGERRAQAVSYCCNARWDPRETTSRRVF